MKKYKKYNYSNLGTNLRMIRTAKNISQRKAAMEMDIDIKAYNKLESRKSPNTHAFTLIKILEYYDVTFEELLGPGQKYAIDH